MEKRILDNALKDAYVEAFINEEKKAVSVIIIPFDPASVLSAAESAFIKACGGMYPCVARPYDIDDFWDVHKIRLRRQYVGLAKCCPIDTFDAEKGIRIAFKRALKQLYIDRNNKITIVQAKLLETVDNLGKEIEKKEEKIRKLNTSIENETR